MHLRARTYHPPSSLSSPNISSNPSRVTVRSAKKEKIAWIIELRFARAINELTSALSERVTSQRYRDPGTRVSPCARSLEQNGMHTWEAFFCASTTCAHTHKLIHTHTRTHTHTHVTVYRVYDTVSSSRSTRMTY